MKDWVGPKVPVFLNPVDKKDLSLSNIVSHKANIIEKCKVDKFYENDSEQVYLLRILCPKTKIVLVSKDKTYI
ncbi:MAG: hypothetical protein PHE73_08625 [Sulfurovaceae bacterium]|nr:hypothetical protein [Sulfurovaceae bacterium]